MKIIIEDETVGSSGSVTIDSDHVPGVGEDVRWSLNCFQYRGIVRYRLFDFA